MAFEDGSSFVDIGCSLPSEMLSIGIQPQPERRRDSAWGGGGGWPDNSNEGEEQTQRGPWCHRCKNEQSR